MSVSEWINMEFSFVLFLTEEVVSDQGSSAKPGKPLLMLAWVTNVSTSPNLYIEFSTEY